MRTLWFGGSFNPIHYGHLLCSLAAAESAGFDRVVLVPSGRPPLKPCSADLAAATDRLEMCRLAVLGQGMFEVDGFELTRSGPSYTIDTARDIARRYPAEEAVHWLIGGDTVAQLPAWHEASALRREVRFIVMERPEAPIDWTLVPDEWKELQGNIVRARRIEISATEIRQRVKAGRSIDFFTPAPVCKYIHQRRLYR